MYFTVYDPTDGRILRTGHSAQDIAIQAHDGEVVIEGESDPDKDYVDLSGPPTITPKGDYTIDALPLPCTVTIEGVDYSITEQPTFTFNYPGAYRVYVDAGVRFLKKEFTIDYQA